MFPWGKFPSKVEPKFRSRLHPYPLPFLAAQRGGNQVGVGSSANVLLRDGPLPLKSPNRNSDIILEYVTFLNEFIRDLNIKAFIGRTLRKTAQLILRGASTLLNLRFQNDRDSFL
ncbi:unnamed protein product [Protopolystoma xenopodis]|uniref:Uncharacterized protein n=1 Tax=Protopolystoma xenopodis TaxID=117903 RepID=A0A3S5FG95_9PLAT|nr:unnamed protein product [Protopolystoma xenopodis]